METPAPPPPEVVPVPGTEIASSIDNAKATDLTQPQAAPPPQPKLTAPQIQAIETRDQEAIGEVREEIDELSHLKVAPPSEDTDEAREGREQERDRHGNIVRMGSSEPHRPNKLKHPKVFDLHFDGGSRADWGVKLTDPNIPGFVFQEKTRGWEHVDNASFPGMVEGGYMGALANAFPSVDGRTPTYDEFWGEYRSHASQYEQAVLSNPDLAAMVGNTQELSEAIKSGKIALVKSVEGLYVPANGQGLKTLEKMAQDGVRSFGIMWNWENGIGTPQTTEAAGSDPGLTDFGVDVVQQLAQIPGVVIDVSHSSAQTMHDILKIVGTESGRVIASHSGIRDKNMHPRNLPIEIAKAIGENGVIGVPLHNKFIKPENVRTDDGVKASVDDVVTRIVELRKFLGGSEHISLGTDFGGMNKAATIPGIDEITTFGDVLYDAMKKSGEFSENEIVGIFGRNALNYLSNALPSR